MLYTYNNERYEEIFVEGTLFDQIDCDQQYVLFYPNDIKSKVITIEHKKVDSVYDFDFDVDLQSDQSEV